MRHSETGRPQTCLLPVLVLVLTLSTTAVHALLQRVKLVVVSTTSAVQEGLAGGGAWLIVELWEGGAAISRLRPQVTGC